MTEQKKDQPGLLQINFWVWAAIAVLCLASLVSYFLFDEFAFHWFRDNPVSWQNNVMIQAIRNFGRAWAPIWLLLNWVCATGKQRPAQAALLALLLVFLAVCTIKPLVQRPRPRDIIKLDSSVGDKNVITRSWAFPSGDAATVFAVAAALAPFVRWYWTLIFFSIAGFVGFMRVVLLAHYPSDVCAGAAIGIFSGALAVQITRRWLSEPSRLNFNRSAYVIAAVLIPVLLGVFSGKDRLVFFLESYSAMVAGIYIVTALLKRFQNSVPGKP
jgi:undecaprenyl-diphosphatase